MPWFWRIIINGRIQDIADYLGDSLQLARLQRYRCGYDCFCGVHFMAGSCKNHNPTKSSSSEYFGSCSLADGCSGKVLENAYWTASWALVATYINCNAETKAESDIIVTSSNAETIINALPKINRLFSLQIKIWEDIWWKDWKRHDFVGRKLHRSRSILWKELQKQLWKILMLNWFTPRIWDSSVRVGTFYGSALALLNYVEKDDCQKLYHRYRRRTLHEMKKAMLLHKNWFLHWFWREVATVQNVSSWRNTLEKLYLCMKYELPEITMDEELRLKALKPIRSDARVK